MSGLRSNSRWLLSDLRLKYTYAFARYPLYVASIACRLFGFRVVSTRLLLAAHRASRTSWLDNRVANNLAEISRLSPTMVGPAVKWSYAIGRTLFLRAPRFRHGSLVSRGVVVIKFTATSTYFIRHLDVPRLARYFWIVIEPSSAGYADPELLCWHQSGSVTFIQTSDSRDEQFLNVLKPTFVALPFGSHDWVDPRIFYPTGTKKSYDVAYVAGLNYVKRLHVFAQAIKELKGRCPDVKAVLVASSWGGASFEQLDHLLRWHSVSDVVEVHRDINQAAVNDLLNASRVSLLLSRKEGANRAIIESMFAGTPVILSECNIGVRRAYVNSETGVIASDRDLPECIWRIKTRGFAGNPAAWTRANIAPDKTIQKLAEILRPYDGNQEPPARLWTKANSPEMTYFDEPMKNAAPDRAAIVELFSANNRDMSDAELCRRLDTLFAPMTSL